MRFYIRLVQFFIPGPQVPLGRWNLKHNSKNCENYIANYYGEPGYPNNQKTVWIQKDICSKYFKKQN